MDWNELQKEAKDLGVLERGMTKGQVEKAVEMARGRPDERAAQRTARTGGRIPMGGFRQNLTVPNNILVWAEENALHLRYFVRDRVQRAKQAGYQPVLRSLEYYDDDKDDHRNEDQWYTVAKGRNQDGSPSVNYLMAQPLEFHKEDQSLKSAEVDAVEEALRSGNPTGGEIGNDSMYVPKDAQGRPQISLEREILRR